MGRRVREGGLLEEGVIEDVGIIFEYLHLCICVFVYLCICVFVFEKSGEGRVPVSHRGRRVQRVLESRRNCGSFPNHTTARVHLRQRGRRCAGNCQINLKVQPELRNIRSFAYQARVYPEKTGNCQIN